MEFAGWQLRHYICEVGLVNYRFIINKILRIIYIMLNYYDVRLSTSARG